MNQKKRGFTLIELLAVIVILGIIAVIAVPIVKNITKDAKMKSFMNSARGIIRAGDLYYSRKDMLDEINGDMTFEFPNNIEGLEINGKLPEKGTLTIDKDGNIAIAMSNGKYCATKGFMDKDITITENIEDCKLVNPNSLKALATTSTEVTSIPKCVTSGLNCDLGTKVAIKVNEEDIYHFYVLSSTADEVILIMNRNLYGENEEPEAPWASKEDYNDDEKYGNLGSNSKGPITAVRILKERTNDWTNVPERAYTYSDDGGSKHYEDFTKTMRARLITKTEVDEVTAINNGTIPSWMLINLSSTGDDSSLGYWTSASINTMSTAAFDLTVVGLLDAFVRDTAGLRPVITLEKQ